MELTGSGVHVDYVLGQYEDSPEGDLTKMIKSAISKYENHQRVERSRRGKQGRARSGYVIATGKRAPYGYEYIWQSQRTVWFPADWDGERQHLRRFRRQRHAQQRRTWAGWSPRTVVGR